MGIVLSMMITWVLTGCIVVMILLMPSYMAKILQINTSIQTYLQIGGILLICLGCIISGILADKIGVIKSCVFLVFLELQACFILILYIDKMLILT